MFQKTLPIILLCSSFLIACDNQTAANEKNFKKAIQDYIDQKNYKPVQVCIPKDGIQGTTIKDNREHFIKVINSDESKNLPQEKIDLINKFLEITKNKDENLYVFPKITSTAEEREVLQPLVNIGMLEMVALLPNQWVYFTTEKSNSMYSNESDKNKQFFCSNGKFLVDEITEFTTPSELLGATRTTVHYTIKAKFEDDWANSNEIQQAFKADFLKVKSTYAQRNDPYHYKNFGYNGKPFEIYLVKTNKGWKRP